MKGVYLRVQMERQHLQTGLDRLSCVLLSVLCDCNHLSRHIARRTTQTVWNDVYLFFSEQTVFLTRWLLGTPFHVNI